MHFVHTFLKPPFQNSRSATAFQYSYFITVTVSMFYVHQNATPYTFNLGHTNLMLCFMSKETRMIDSDTRIVI